MDILIEFIVEIVMEVAIEGAKSKKVPKVIRLILFGIIFLFALSLMALFIYLGVAIDSNIIIKLIFLAVALIAFIFLISFIKELIEKR